MEFYLPRQFRWNMPIALTDGQDRVRFTLFGDAYGPGRRLRLTDLAGRTAADIRQTFPALRLHYELEVYGKPLGSVTRALSGGTPCCTVGAAAWTLAGDLKGRNYTAACQGRTVGVSRLQGERVLLELPDRERWLDALAVLVTVHCVFADLTPKGM